MTSSAVEVLSTALAHHQAGELAVAEQLYRQVLAENPGNAEAWHLLGTLCLQSGRPIEAVDYIGRAIAIQPANPDYYNHLGAAHGALGHHDEAIANLRRAVELAPHSAPGHYNLGTALRNRGLLEEAVASFRSAVALNPNAAEAHYNLANTLRELKRLIEAEASYRAALRVRSNYMKAMINLANVLHGLEKTDEAIAMLRSAVALDPNYANAQLNLGTTLRDRGELDEAVEHLRRAVALEPNAAEAQNNLGTVLQGLGRYEEAADCYERALACDPNFPDAHFGRALYKLRRGDLAGGFAEYEWRWKCSGFSERPFSQPRWDGSPLEGRSLLLYAEQGLGDTLQFVRFAAVAKQRGARVVVECQKPLLNILASCTSIDQLVALASPLPAFDVHAPLMSLPGILNLSLDTLWSGPYLTAKEQLVESWRGVLAQYPEFRIGVCWQGNPKNLFDRQRSYGVKRLSRLAQIPGVRLVSLQKASASEPMEPAGFELVDLGSQLDEASGPFMDTAAVMKSLDLVIAADTSIAHLAGALGVNVWVPLSANCDWRWMMDRDDTPWYPTMRFFRQQKLNEWQDVFERVAKALEQRMATTYKSSSQTVR